MSAEPALDAVVPIARVKRPPRHLCHGRGSNRAYKLARDAEQDARVERLIRRAAKEGGAR